MFKNLLVRRAVRHALVANALVMACAATQAAEDNITEIVVTGSRIARPGGRSVDAGPDHQRRSIAEQGAPNIADIFKSCRR